LAFHYQYIRILINRPCLCRLDYRIPNESKRSRGFNRTAAVTCVEAARELIALLPDEPNPVGLMTISPWWCLLHYLVSAGTVLIVEIAMRAEHNPQQADGLLKDSKKLVSWLRAMGKDNLAAERSWTVLSRLLIIAAPKIGGDTSDVQRDFPPSNRKHGAGKPASKNHGKPGQSLGEYGHPHGQIPSNSGAPMDNNQDQQLEDFPDIFRGILADPFPFACPPIQTHFDNPISMPQAPPQFMSPANDRTSFTPSHEASASLMQIQTTPTSLMFPTPEQLQSLDKEEVVHKKHERRQRRKQSQGVGQISLPPPLTSQWASSSPLHSLSLLHTQGSGEPFAMGSLAHTFRVSGHGSRATGTTFEDPISTGCRRDPESGCEN
jgi:hypothetical protein